MKRYTEYKDSGIEWIGEIPNTWDRTKLKRLLATPITDGPHETPEILDEGIPFVSAESIKNLQINFDLKRGYISLENHERFCKKCKPQYGDIFMIKSGATTGNIAKVETHEEFSVWSPLALIRVNADKIYNDYMFQYLQSRVFRLQVELFWSYGTQQNIGMEVLGNLYVAYPAIDEQKRIAEYLKNRTNKIDTLIADKQALITLLKEKRQAIISGAVTKGLDKNAKMKDSGVEWIGEIPEGWEAKKLKYLGKAIIGLTYSPGEIVDTAESGTLVLRSSNVQNGQIVYDDNVYVDKEIPSNLRTIKGDILICSRNGSRDLIGKNAIIGADDADNSFGAFMTIFRSTYNPFLYYIFNSIIFKFLSGSFLTSTINQLTTGNLNNMIVPFPEVSIQEEIVNYLNIEVEKIDFLISDIEIQIEKLKEYRQSIISEAVTGKVAI